MPRSPSRCWRSSRRHSAGEPPGLAIVDLTNGGSTSISRGAGHVRVSGADRLLTLDGGEDPAARATMRRLAGGVVAASRGDAQPARAPHGRTRRAGVLAPACRRRPADRRHPRLDPGGQRARRSPAPTAATRAPEPEHDTGSLNDTTEPDPDSCERISAGTHTTIQPPGSPAADHRRGRAPPDADRRPRRLDRPPARARRAPAARHDRHGAGDELPERAPDSRRQLGVPGLSPAGRPAGAASACRVRPWAACACRPVRSCRSTVASCSVASRPRSRTAPTGRTWCTCPRTTPSSRACTCTSSSTAGTSWRATSSREVAPCSPCPAAIPNECGAGEAYVLEPGCSLDLAEVYEVRFEVGRRSW